LDSLWALLLRTRCTAIVIVVQLGVFFVLKTDGIVVVAITSTPTFRSRCDDHGCERRPKRATLDFTLRRRLTRFPK
jgi:hypothetical protein